MSVDERLREWTPRASGNADLDAVVGRAVSAGRSRVRRRRVIGGLAALAVIAGVAGVATAATHDDASTVDVIAPTTTTEGAGLFAEATGHVLLFDDGYDGVVAVDLDTAVAVRQVIEGQRAGDQDPRFARSGGSLLVGWGEPYAVRLDGSAPPRSLGEATVFVPAFEPDRAWLVDWEGGRVGVGAQTVWQVDTDGDTVVQAFGLESGIPTVGVPGGVAVEQDGSFTIFDADGTPRTSHAGRPILSTPTELVFYEGLAELQFLDYATGDVRAVQPGLTFEPSTARLSPDGRSIALGGSARGAIVVDIASGATTAVVTESIDPPMHVAWAPDGTLYVVPSSYASSTTTLWRWTAAGGTEQIDLPIGGLLSFLAIDASEAGLVDWDAPRDAACPPPSIQPSGRTGACAIDLHP
jgi:hypothetical protein